MTSAANAPANEGYAREELVAELGAAFLCAELAITPSVREDHAAYVQHWLAALKSDKRAIFSAAAHAQRATDYLSRLQNADTQDTMPHAASNARRRLRRQQRLLKQARVRWSLI